ncbi:MAG: ZipA [Rhodocyclaceae bacterium]|nr:ZipA [Rhodocyclaceae bacterium]
MALTDLQTGLIALGAAGIAGVLVYNKWQERKHRRHAEKVFGRDHADVLIDGAPERREPVLGDAGDAAVEAAAAPAAAEPALPVPEFDLADAKTETVVAVTLSEPLPGGELVRRIAPLFEPAHKPVRWYVLDESARTWQELTPQCALRAGELRAVLQLADRSGALDAAEFDAFMQGLKQIADRFLAVVDYPVRSELLQRATALDEFCASVDVVIGVNVVSGSTAFAGTKLRGLLEAAGMKLAGDGAFHMCDDVGATQFTLANIEPELFDADGLKNLSTQGLTLALDLPRVAQGPQVFDRMIAVAQQIVQALHGSLVDDNRNVLNEASLSLIRKQIAEFQGRMIAYGIMPGSVVAARLFS